MPRYYAQRAWPADIQCSAQAIDSLVLLSTSLRDRSLLMVAEGVAAWTIANMQDHDGHFVLQRWPKVVNRTPTLHWGQATMLHALAHLRLSQGKS
jgi:hypothetical protein